MLGLGLSVPEIGARLGGGGGSGPSGDGLLLETGDFLLLEDGSFLLLE